MDESRKQTTSAGAIQASISGEIVSGLDFVGNTGELAIAGSDPVLWHYNTTQCCDTKLSLPGPAITLAANPHDPDEFVASTSNGVFIVTVNHSGKPQSTLHLTGQSGYDAQSSPDGSEVVITGDDGSVEIYQVATRKVMATFSAYGAMAVNAAFGPNGKQIVAGYQDGTARVWDVATKLQLTLLTGHSARSALSSLVPTAGKSRRRAKTEPSGFGTRNRASSGRNSRSCLTTARQATWEQAEYISNRIITTDTTGNVFVYSPSGKLQATIKTDSVGQLVNWNRPGTKIMIFTVDGKAELWQATGSGYTRISSKDTIGLGYSLADNAVMSQDGSRLAFVADNQSDFANAYLTDRLIQVQDVNTGKVLRNLLAVNAIRVVTFSPNGQQIVGADASGQIESWNGKATGPQVLGSPGPTLRTVTFNQSGSEFVAASVGGVVTVWSARDGRVVTSINACPSPNSAAFSPDGNRIVVACPDGTVRVFDAGTGRPLTVIQATSAGPVSDAGFSPDGKSIIAGINAGDSGEVEILNAELATPSLPALERIAEQRVGDKLTAAQLQQYLSDASS